VGAAGGQTGQTARGCALGTPGQRRRLEEHSILSHARGKRAEDSRAILPHARGKRGYGGAASGATVPCAIRYAAISGAVFLPERHSALPKRGGRIAALEATQGQMDGFFSQIPSKCYLEEVASVGD